MLSRLAAVSAVFLASVSNLAAQQTCKPIEVPIGVISMSGEPFRGLAAEDFVAQAHKKAVSLKSLTFDEGPRRILLVVDASRTLSADARKAQAVMVAALLAAARPEDSFALLSAKGPGRNVAFTSDHGAIAEVLGSTGSQEGKDPGVLDQVMKGAEQFGAPQNGDAIVVIAADLEGNHKANTKMVAKALDDRRIRMFGLALGPVATGNSMLRATTSSASSRGLASTTTSADTIYETGDENFFPLTVNSGGLVLAAMNADPRRSYKMDDQRLVQELQQKARSVARMIDTFYRAQVEAPPRAEDWGLEINDDIKKHSPPMFILYPRTLGPC